MTEQRGPGCEEVSINAKHLRGSCKPAWMVLGRHFRAGGHEQKHESMKGGLPQGQTKGRDSTRAKPGMV